MPKDNFKCQLHECCLITRHPDDILFYLNMNGEILCNLDRYAILPMEEYEKLVQSATGTRNT